MGRSKNWVLKPVKIEGDIAIVPLSRGLEAIIDADDAALIGKYNWCARPASRDFYAVTTIRENGVAKQWTMHDFLMRPPKGMRVDHRSAKTLDNRSSQLRIVTHAQNMQNRGWFRNNSTGFKGVIQIWNKYIAKIRANGKVHYLGSFDTAEEAGRAYAEASKRLHGEFRPSEDRLIPPKETISISKPTPAQMRFLRSLLENGSISATTTKSERGIMAMAMEARGLIKLHEGSWVLSALGNDWASR